MLRGNGIYIYYRLQRVARLENVTYDIQCGWTRRAGWFFTTKHRCKNKIGREGNRVEGKSVWKERRNVSQHSFSPPVLFNYSIVKELFLLLLVQMFELFSKNNREYSLFSARKKIRKKSSRKIIPRRTKMRYKIKFTEYNVF